MNNLSFDELKNLAESTADSTVLEQISGGTENDCHDDSKQAENRDLRPR